MSKKKQTKSSLIIRGAKVHNLKNVDVEIPKNSFVVITGVSGSGKSSLAFDTIFAEGQRRYVESLSAYARQFLGVMDKPDVESIDGISPAIAIDQKTISRNPRSTVGTITEIYDYLRLLFARVGVPYCPEGHGEITRQSPAQIRGRLGGLAGEVHILAPLVRGRKGEHRAIMEELVESGFMRVRLDGHIMTLEEAQGMDLDPKKKHTIEVVVDRVIFSADEKLDTVRLTDSIETALKIGKGLLIAHEVESGKDVMFSEQFACPDCGFSADEIEPRTFSFNSPYGACERCSGLGTQMEADPDLIIPNKKLSIAEGAIKPWMSASYRVGRQGWYWYTLRQMADKHGFSLDVPVGELAPEVIDVVLYGDGDLEGVVPNLERRYKETDSDWTRAEIEKYMHIHDCSLCEGRRLKGIALCVKIGEKSIDDVVHMSIDEAFRWSSALRLQGAERKRIAEPIMKEVAKRLMFLDNVGLSYLSLARGSGSLSGGEAQRIRLATQLGSYLSGVLYILDEPSIGLHMRDQKKLIEMLKDLRDLGNSVIVVEHDEETMRSADWIIDVGPGAGKYGGEIIFEGTPEQLMRSKTSTGEYLSGKKNVTRKRKTKKATKFLTVAGAEENNLKNVTTKIPLGQLVCVTGVSGSGKSSLINDILAKALLRELHGAHTIAGLHKKITGIGNLNKVIVVDQSPIGRTPRSNAATYTGAFTIVRGLFAQTREAKIRGYGPGRFSFNVKGGRCEACQGGGVRRVEMFFLPDVYVECEECKGRRYTAEALEVLYKGKNIADVLEMTIDDAVSFFGSIPSLKIKLAVLQKVGLGYLELGQPAPSLSGGEAQRVKLASELARRDTGKTLYILDEPTVGLHFQDVQKLLDVLSELVEKGNSVLVIEHTMDFIRNADWIIDLGPEGGDKGGELVAEGTPKDIKKNKKSYTGKYL